MIQGMKMKYTSEQLREDTQAIFDRILALQAEKGNDYADDEDCLSNYRELGYDYCIKRNWEKAKRMLKLLKTKQDSKIEAELMDIINICVLARILLPYNPVTPDYHIKEIESLTYGQKVKV